MARDQLPLQCAALPLSVR